jgi:2-C-methyl-D-erythritol 4-phosphate cytidylyltransferase
MPKFAVILPAAGESRRFRHPHYKKPFAPLKGKAVWLYSAENFMKRTEVAQTILAISPGDREAFVNKFGANLTIHDIQLVDGGRERADSISNAMAQLQDDIEYVCVHDTARPCLSELWIDAVFEKAIATGAAMLAVPVAATLKRVGKDRIIEKTVSRDHVWEAQTPQVFRRDWLEEAYARRDGFQATDDAQLLERIGKPVSVVPCSHMNLKITTRDDLRLAEKILDVLPRPRLSDGRMGGGPSGSKPQGRPPKGGIPGFG